MADQSDAFREYLFHQIMTSLEGMVGKTGVHAESAITAAGGLAGQAMLRSSAPPEIYECEPGTVVLVDGVDRLGPDVIMILQKVCQKCGIDPSGDWDDDIPLEHQSLEDVHHLTHRLQPLVWAALPRFSISEEQAAFLCAIVGVQIIAHTRDVLNPNIGKALLLKALVSASKTVPLR